MSKLTSDPALLSRVSARNGYLVSGFPVGFLLNCRNLTGSPVQETNLYLCPESWDFSLTWLCIRSHLELFATGSALWLLYEDEGPVSAQQCCLYSICSKSLLKVVDKEVLQLQAKGCLLKPMLACCYEQELSSSGIMSMLQPHDMGRNNVLQGPAVHVWWVYTRG